MSAPEEDYSFEETTPAAPKTRRAKPERIPPHSIEAEEHLLSCCLLDGDDTIARCMAEGLVTQAFYSPANRLIYEELLRIYVRDGRADIAILAQELKEAKRLDGIGGFAYLTQISSRSPTTAQAQYFIDKVKELSVLREAILRATSIVERAYEYQGGLEEFIEQTRSDIDAIGSSRKAVAAAPITQFKYPADADPNILLGSDDYLGRGGGMLFISHAGAGKSSWIMDACMSWAIGRPWMGIRCNGALRSLIIQAEDSVRYMGKVQESFAFAQKLSEQEVAVLGSNCVVARVKGVCGAAFFAELRRLAVKHKPDLVVINPIYIYAEGDISRSEFAQPFLVGLDAVNRDEKFGYVLVHHTGKPAAKDKEGKRAEVEDWESVYMGFGSSYLANWPRCSALLEPRPQTKGRYVIKLGKGGLNAGIGKEVPQGTGTRLEPVTRINIRHSEQKMKVNNVDRPVIYWEVDSETASGGAMAERVELAKPIRPCAFEEIRRMFPADQAKAIAMGEITRLCGEFTASSPSSVKSAVFQAERDGILAKTTDGRFYRVT